MYITASAFIDFSYITEVCLNAQCGTHKRIKVLEFRA
jgi:hypothetical protein